MDLDDIALKVRSGQVKEAIASLNKVLKSHKYKQRDEAVLANLLRRCGQPQVSLGILRKRIFHDAVPKFEAFPKESAEYAAALIALGSTSEANRILSLLELQSSKPPEVALFASYLHLRQWDYKSAALSLKTYLDSNKLASYERLVGQVNLAAALLVTEDRDFDRVLRQAQSGAAELKALRLQANLAEIELQASISRNDQAQALKAIQNLESKVNQTPTEKLIVQKWRGVLLLRSRKVSQAQQVLQEARKAALKQNDPELLRHLDLYVSLATQNQVLLNRVLVGTPFSNFLDINKIEIEKFGLKAEVPESAEWNLSPSDGQANIKRGALFRDSDLEESQNLPFRLYRAFLYDTYRAPTTVEIHERLNPDLMYHPRSSPNAIDQLIHRLNQAFKQKKLKLFASIQSSRLSITCSKSEFWVPIAPQLIKAKAESALLVMHKKLKDQFHSKDFSAKQAALALSKPQRSVQRALKGLKEAGLLAASGQGRLCEYKVQG
jgi:DNA-binding transcriptional ArsR family regulator